MLGDCRSYEGNTTYMNTALYTLPFINGINKVSKILESEYVLFSFVRWINIRMDAKQDAPCKYSVKVTFLLNNFYYI